MGFLSSLFGFDDAKPAQSTVVQATSIPEELKPFVTEVLETSQQQFQDDIAKGYTKKGRNLASSYNISYEPTLYRIDQPSKINLFDMESPLSADTKEALTETLGDYSYLLDESKNLRELYDEFRIDGTNDFMSADDIQDYFDSIKDVLQKKGYKGFEHKGGLLTGKSPHNVRIYWEPTKDIKFKELKPEVMSTSRAQIIE